MVGLERTGEQHGVGLLIGRPRKRGRLRLEREVVALEVAHGRRRLEQRVPDRLLSARIQVERLLDARQRRLLDDGERLERRVLSHELRERRLAPRMIVREVERAQRRARAQRAAHGFQPFGPEQIRSQVDVGERLVRREAARELAHSSRRLAERAEHVIRQVEGRERRRGREHARKPCRVLILLPDLVAAQHEPLQRRVALHEQPERVQADRLELTVLGREVPGRAPLGKQRAQMTRRNPASVVHERVVEELGRELVRGPARPAFGGHDEQVLREQPLLEREVLELVLRGRGFGLRLERLRERNPRLLLVQVQPHGERVRIGHLEEQRVRDVSA